MKLSFLTLGCPTWNLETICAQGRALGFDGVDFRGLAETLDVTTLPAFTTNAAATKRMLADAGLEVSGISSSIQVCDASARNAILDEAKRTIAVCHGLGCVNVRVFGGGKVGEIARERAAAVGRECVEQILALDGASSVRWLFETHDHWVRAADCRLLLDAIPSPAFGALWDMGHTYRVGGERPADSYAAVGPRVRYTHVKDAVRDAASNDGWRYVAPGEGELPLAESVSLLRAGGYDGWLAFEHEKRWIPSLPEPEQIFPKFVAWARKLLDA
jgi:sugar phosphate isomerase/epimerase